MKPSAGMTTTRIRDFTRMNPLEFYGSKVNEDPQEFIDKLYKIMEIMGVSHLLNVELFTYKLKGVSQVWFKQWNEERVVDVGNMSVKKYALKFTQLAKYTMIMVADTRPMTSKFVSGVPEMVVKECRTAR
ncbi:hypothetical protein MTR67_051299 [Solanum verrucosum]|uniref:Gag-pol polyprotein n=1 Tax=Solanum verrucosum TaxID=315347 RepID=A0AAF0V685_SOLVR|nr:hypothetical protein MTR67_051299 [Solanum verrucosum]